MENIRNQMNKGLALVAGWMLIALSCNYLDLVPDDIPTMELAFNNRQNAERFLYTCYGYVPRHGQDLSNPALSTGDEVWFSSQSSAQHYNYTTFSIAMGLQNADNPLVNYWSGGNGGSNLFMALRDCNIFLDNIEQVRDMTEREKAQWIAEIKTLKAYYHYFMMQLYGPIPVIRENIPVSASPEDVLVVREPVDEVVRYIVQLIDEATADKANNEPSLPLYIRNTNLEYGRLTLATALAIKAKALLLAASPLFNGNPDFRDYKNAQGINLINPVEDPSKWQAASEACFEAIEYAHKGGHQLYMFDDVLMFEVSNETLLELTLRHTITKPYNRELIWGLGTTGFGTWDNDTETLQRLCGAPLRAEENDHNLGEHAPTLKIAEQFYTRNGVPIEEDKTYDYELRYEVLDAPDEDHEWYLSPNVRTAYLNMNREPRFYAFLGFDGNRWFSLGAPDGQFVDVTAKAGQLQGMKASYYNVTGYFCKKLVSYKTIMNRTQFSPSLYTFPIIRLADLYLMYAEALNETKSSPDATVYQYIQEVRNKAGLDRETGSLVKTWETYSSNPNKPTTKEGMRDIIRRERLIELAFEGSRFYDLRRWRLSYDYLNQPVKGWNVYAGDENYYRIVNIYNRKFALKDYFWPIRQQDLYVNKNLIQSPFWAIESR